jgi:hypothetical protein
MGIQINGNNDTITAIDGSITVGTDLTVPGVLTFEDVTNVDSVGFITARNGVIISAGTATTALVVNGDTRITGILTASTSSLQPIDFTKSDNVVDLFVYDTRKDSDLGAWRKNTDHLSWHTETLNTATRGSRREFPQVALIAAEETKITIYDGDDPNLPMWMVFNQGVGRMLDTDSGSVKSITAMNGVITWAADSDLHILFLLADKKFKKSNTRTASNNGTVQQRNSNSGYADLGSRDFPTLSNRRTNSVAMTVLPSSSIDPTTGLPRPTIAVSTDLGIQLVVGAAATATSGIGSERIYQSSTDNLQFRQVNFINGRGEVSNGMYKFATHVYSSTTSPLYIYDASRITSDSYAPIAQYGHTGATRTGTIRSNDGTEQIRVAGNAIGVGESFNSGGSLNMVLDIGIEEDVDYTGAVAGISTSFNTGYQYGRCWVAALCNTDNSTTGVTSTAVFNNIDNYDFSNGTTGWSSNGTSIISVASEQMSIDRNGGSVSEQCYQDITTKVGQGYAVFVDVVAVSDNFRIYVSPAESPKSLRASGFQATATGEKRFEFTARSTSTRLELGATGNINGTCTIDNVRLYEVEADNMNYEGPGGFNIKGTVSKRQVAPGAELQCYGPFDENNYFEQSYVEELNFGTNPFSAMGWFRWYDGNPDGSQRIFRRGIWNGSWSDGIFSAYIQAGGTMGFNVTPNGFTNTDSLSGTKDHADGNWHHLVCCRDADGMKIYVDGDMEASTTAGATTNVTSVDPASLVIGGDQSEVNGIMWTGGELALWRFSEGCPTPGQISKIYNEEKKMFADNAVCTLYGSSNNITALDYDPLTDTHHVGTSDGRSDFRGLLRINNTTTGITSAISAYDGFIAEQ